MFVSPSTVAVFRQRTKAGAMLGTGDVAIIYHISSTAANGWLAGHSDTASKPRRQQAVHPTSRARLSANPETRRRGRRARRALQTAARHRAITEDEAALDASDLGRSRY